MDTYTVTGVRPFGTFDTVIRFDALTQDGERVTVAADHRMARPIREALARGEEPEVQAPGWAVFGAPDPPSLGTPGWQPFGGDHWEG